MNEREELLTKFNKAMPLVEELSKREDKSVKYNKTKDRLAKIIVLCAFFVALGLIVCISADMGDCLSGCVPFVIFLAIMIWLSVVNKKKITLNNTEIVKILGSEELSFIPFSYHNSFDIIGIYKVLLDMRADTFKEALNVWEQDKHNMVMEAKSAVIVK